MTKIEWTKRPGTIGVAWNPLRVRNLETGGIGHFCEKVSAGCKNCYAETFQKRFQNPIRYAAQDADQVEVFLDEKTLLEPLKWKKPRTIFVCSQTDIFLRHYSDEMICKVFAVMALCPFDTLIVLTKRPERAKVFLQSEQMQEQIGQMMREIDPGATCYQCPDLDGIWPLRNVWLGTSVEDQATANERIPVLLDTPAAVRFISAEPLLGPIDVSRWLSVAWQCSGCRGYFSGGWQRTCPDCGKTNYWSGSHKFNGRKRPKNPICPPQSGQGLDWVIVGGESGNKGRPMHPDWARSLRDQCKAADVPFFFKQWGAWFATYDRDHDDPDWRKIPKIKGNHQRFVNIKGGHGFHGDRVVFMEKSSKKKTGRLLDGVEHNAWPGDAA